MVKNLAKKVDKFYRKDEYPSKILDDLCINVSLTFVKG
jgi:hypothetical protein